MKTLSLISVVITLAACSSSPKRTAELPSWVRMGSDASTVVCSHDALDPEEARVHAEVKCLSAGAKLSGVRIHLKNKSIDSLDGADTSEVAEVEPLRNEVKCNWINRYLETLDSGYRVWLACRVQTAPNSTTEVVAIPETNERKPTSLSYKRATLNIITVPKADKVIIGNSVGGERIIDITSNSQLVELREGDETFEVKKHRYRTEKKTIPDFKHGDALSFTINFEQEF